MIYTITFNPALDYITQVDNFEIGKVNRTITEKILAGGKGLNVSIVLKNLEIDNTAISFIAGFTGDELERIIKEHNIKTDFINVQNGNTRINVKISSSINQIKKIESQKDFLEKNSNNLKDNFKYIKKEEDIDRKEFIETALNGNGPQITMQDVEKLLEKINQIKPQDLVILSGNVPKCINEKIYEIISKELKQKKIPFVNKETKKLLIK